MSNSYGILLDRQTGMPKWQVFYGEREPGGEGWQKVPAGGVLTDKSQTSAKWFRAYATARSEKKKAEQASKPAAQRSEPDKKPTGFWDKIRAVRDFVRDEVVKYKPKDQKPKIKAHYGVGDRVMLQGGHIGYVQAVLDEENYSIFDTSTSMVANMHLADILHSEKAPPAQYAVGDTVIMRNGDAATVAAVNKAGQLKVDTASGETEWTYPESVSRAGKESEKDLKALDKQLETYKAGHPERAVVGSLVRALHSTRSTTTITELMDDLAITGNVIPRDTAVGALRELAARYPNIVFDPGKELIDISGGKEGLARIAEKIGASVASGPYGWSPRPSANGVFSAPGMQFVLPPGSIVSADSEGGAKVKAEITSGRIVAHQGGAAVLEVLDANGNSYKVRSSDIDREDGRSFWKTAKTPEGKQIQPDPFDPSLYGDVVRDNFWLLRDREACRGTEPGDMVKSLPFAIADADGRYSDVQLAGRVLDRMVDTGLLRVQFEDGRVLDVSPRMVALSRDMSSMNDIYSLATVRRSAVYGSTFALPSGTRLAFGNAETKAADVREPREGDEVEFETRIPGRFFGEKTVSGRGKIVEIRRAGNKVRYVVEYQGKQYEDIKANQMALIGRHGMQKVPSTIRITYQSRKHFDEAYAELFIKGGEEGFFSRMFGRSTSDIFDTDSPPFMPNQAFMRTFMHLYPAADSMSARAYHDNATKEFVVEVGPDKSVGRAFDMSEILPKVFADVAPGSGAMRVDDYEKKFWKGERIDVTSDGNSLYVRVGDKLDQNLTALDALRPANAKSTKLYHAVTASKQRAYETLGKSDPELFHAISRFTYDPAGKRFVADLSDYSEKGAVLRGLRKLFGDKVNIYESTDRTWWYPAGKGPVARLANDRASVLTQIKGAKHNDELPPIKDFGHKAGFELFKVQKEVVNFITAPGQNTVLLANDQGTGKTPIITASIMKWAEEGSVKRALVVVPASITGNWREEIEAWTGKSPKFAQDNLVMLSGERRAEYGRLHGKNPPLITVVSYDTLLRDYKELSAIQWDAIALDEAQNIKNVGTKRERVLKKVFDTAPKRIAATGTAIENDPSDLFSIMEFLSPDTFGSKQKFDNDFIEYDDVKHKDSNGVERVTTVPVGVKNIGLLRSKLLPLMVRVDKDKMRAAMDEELGPQLRKEFGKDIKLLGERIKRPWPVLVKNAAGKYEAKFRPEDEELLIHRDDYTHSHYWEAHDKAVEYLMEHTAAAKNPLASLVIMQQVADDPTLMLAHIKPEHTAVRHYFERFNERNADGTYKYKHPKRDKLLETVRKHIADPKNGKIIVFSQSTAVLDNMQDWLYSDPEIRKYLGLGQTAFQNALATRKMTTTPGLLRYTGGMKSGMRKADAEAILRRITAGASSEKETAAAAKERAYVRNAFQNDPSAKILLASDAAQTGLTLTAANLVVNYNLGWNPKAMDQRIDRAHRIDIAGAKKLADQGGARDIMAVNIIAKGTVDEKKMPKLAWKDHMFDLIVSGQASTDEAIISADTESDADILRVLYDERIHKKKARESHALEKICALEAAATGGFRWL